MSRWRALPCFTLALGVARFALACDSTPSDAPTVVNAVGDFRVAISPSHARLTIAAGGHYLVEGVPASTDVGTPESANDDAPPMTGFAVRDVAATYEMMYGSFNITEDTSNPWRIATQGAWANAGAPVTLSDDGGAILARITFSRGDDDDHLIADVEPGDGPERRMSWGFACAPTDRFVGFGEQTWGTGARGETIPIWVSEEGIGKDLTTDDPTGLWFLVGRRHSSQMPLPEFYSRRGFMSVVETNAISTFALCSERDDVARMQFQMPAKVHFFYGATPQDAVREMTGHFGRPRVPPAFAFAPWNDAIFGSTNVRRIATELRANHIPSSVIWTEDWRGGAYNPDGSYSLKEEWDVDRSLYPDFEAVAHDLHAAGFKWLVYFNSFVEQDSAAWPETAPNGYLIKGADGQPETFFDGKFLPASMVDLTNPAAVAWAVGKMSAAITLGADGWMGDFGEWLPTDATLAGGSGLDLHNLYPVLWQTAQRQALDSAIARDGVERLSFVRSGWLGSPPLVDVFWGGDQRTDFEADDGMPTVLPIGLGVGLAGISTFGSDIAGYQSATNGPVTQELFFRWTELGAWSPVMRTHHGTTPNANVSFETNADTLAHWSRYARLHMQLAPYLRGLAQVAHDTGLSIWRGLAITFPDDDAVWTIADEAMVGDGVLIAPVQTEGATSRSVYFPAGSWFPWAGGPAIVGPLTLPIDAAVSEIPVFARAGAILPLYPDSDVETLVVEPGSAPSASAAADDRVVMAFAGASGAFAEAPDAGGLSYSIDSASPLPLVGDVGVSWNASPIPACASVASTCADVTDGVVTAHVFGTGTLSVTRDGAPLANVICAFSTPRPQTRALTIVLRY